MLKTGGSSSGSGFGGSSSLYLTPNVSACWRLSDGLISIKCSDTTLPNSLNLCAICVIKLLVYHPPNICQVRTLSISAERVPFPGPNSTKRNVLGFFKSVHSATLHTPISYSHDGVRDKKRVCVSG